jgi:hypothetical protein|tara:strand:+ start:105 stop:275 length:171 start_codon:yes stop_codon:yes gene_type:complete
MLHINRIKIYQKFMDNPEDLSDNEIDILKMFDEEFDAWLKKRGADFSAPPSQRNKE